MKKKMLVALMFSLFVGFLCTTKAQTNIAALVNQANVFTNTNTFLDGVSLPGTSGQVVLTAPVVSGGITYTLPGLPGSPGYALCIGSLPGILAYCPPPGGGAGVPTVNLAPAALDFGTVQMNGTKTLTILLENTGTAPLIFGTNGFVISGQNGSEFTVNTNCATPLDAGWVCQLLVTLQPLSIDPKYAQLTITNNAGVGQQVAVLTGTGG